jgi:cell division protein FtsB
MNRKQIIEAIAEALDPLARRIVRIEDAISALQQSAPTLAAHAPNPEREAEYTRLDLVRAFAGYGASEAVLLADEAMEFVKHGTTTRATAAMQRKREQMEADMARYQLRTGPSPADPHPELFANAFTVDEPAVAEIARHELSLVKSGDVA